MTENPKTLADLLSNAPKNWGRWGPDDELGALNFLGADEVMSGVKTVRQGKVFTLQVPIGDPRGDPISPGRQGARRMSVIDKGQWLAGKGRAFPGGFEYADDYICMYLQGTTHYDALGHAWSGDQIWNGYDATTTIGGLSKASIRPLADHGIVGRGILLDLARHRGKATLDLGESFTHEDLVECAERQGSPIQKRDVLVIRTGWVGWFYQVGPEVAFRDFREPGLVYSPQLVRWFHDMEIPSIVTDTTADEIESDPVSGFQWPLHIALMSYLGITLAETAWLDDLATDCATDGQYQFLFVGAPLKVNEGTGAPVNPVVIK